jgi:hypothetical protein
MANSRISSLTSLGATPNTADIIPITDVSDTTGSPQGTTKKVTVANLVAAAPQGDLQASNNLSDVASASTARTNLGLGTAATTASSDYATSAQGALADSATQPGDLGTAATLNVGTSASNVVQLNGSAQLPAVDGSNLTGISTAVEGTAVLSTGETGGTKFLREDGDGTCSFQEATADVETPLNTALRGTDNPHIGAHPNQSFKVADNPYKSVMLIADEEGNLKLVNSLGVNNIAVGFSVVEDGTEPDIEVVSGNETFSVMSGDSDSTGINGLPVRQGFNVKDIGSNPAPLLISGGSIS